MRRTTSANAAPRSGASVAAPAPVQPQPPRRNVRLLVIGVLAVCLGALAGAGLYFQGAHTHQVLRLARTVPRGTVVQATDLGVVSLPAVPGVATVPATESPELVGQEALTDLAEGSLLVPGSVGRPTVAEGTVHIGVKLAPGRVPARLLPVDAPVLLIPVPGGGSATANPASGATYRARVVTAPALQPDGSQLVDLAVSAGDATHVVALAAADQLVVAREEER